MVGIVRVKDWRKLLKRFLVYRVNAKKIERGNKLEEYRHEQLVGVQKEVVKAICLKVEMKARIMLQRHFMKWIKFNKESIVKDHLIASSCRKLASTMRKKLLNAGVRVLLDDWKAVSVRKEKVDSSMEMLCKLCIYKKVRAAFTRYRDNTWKAARDELYRRTTFENVFKIANKFRLFLLRAANNTWRFSILKKLKADAVQFEKDLTMQEQLLEHNKFLIEINARSLSLLEYEYQTADDISNSQALAKIVRDIKGLVCRKIGCDDCVLSLLAPISALFNSAGPYLLLEEPKIDNPLYRATVDSLKKVHNRNFSSATRVKTQELSAKFALPSVSADDPIILQAGDKSNHFDTTKEPYATALKRRRVEMMKTGVVFPILEMQGTLELYWISQSNDPIDVSFTLSSRKRRLEASWK